MKTAGRLFDRRVYRITHLDACDSGKRDIWLEWRRTLKLVPTSSTLCSYFGYGHQSLNALIHEKIQDEPQVKPATYGFSFSDKAKRHGTDNEHKAKKLFKRYLKEEELAQYMEVQQGELSYYSKIQWGDHEPVEVVCTPDSLYMFNNHLGWGKMVVEYKCPYKIVVERKNDTILSVVLNFAKTNPFGKHGAFVQASTYALWCQAEFIYTVFYFTDFLDEEYIVVFCYEPSERLFDIIYQALSDTGKYLKELNEIQDKTQKTYRTSSTVKKEIDSLMELCLVEKTIYDKTGKSFYF